MRLGLAQAPFPPSLAGGVEQVRRLLTQAAGQGCELICLPEAYLPGMRGAGFPVEEFDQAALAGALSQARKACREAGVALILPMEWQGEQGRHNLAFVIDGSGQVLGYQAKNQIPIEEEAWCVPDGLRRLFQVGELTFGIAICHEGWRYPETVRWAAVRGAQVVFHPHFCGGPAGSPVTEAEPYYEKAMLCRSLENNIYFASVNYALPYQESATGLVSPDGRFLAQAACGKEQLLVVEVDPALATGSLAQRYRPDLYGEGA